MVPERVHIPGLRGLCGTCGHDYPIRNDGRLPRHGPQKGPRCDGSRRQPQALKAAGGKWKAVEG